MSVLPKVEINKFLEANKGLFEKLRGKVGLVKGRLEELEQISKEIKRFYDKIDLKAMANKYYRDLKPENR